MISGSSILKIIRQQPSAQTGETIYQTEDGTWWEAVQYKESYGTGDRYGNKTDGYIKGNKK